MEPVRSGLGGHRLVQHRDVGNDGVERIEDPLGLLDGDAILFRHALGLLVIAAGQGDRLGFVVVHPAAGCLFDVGVQLHPLAETFRDFRCTREAGEQSVMTLDDRLLGPVIALCPQTTIFREEAFAERARIKERTPFRELLCIRITAGEPHGARTTIVA